MKNQKDIGLLALIAVTSCLVGTCAGGSCRAAKLCCQGRDSGCVIQKASPNAIIEGPRDKPCYCDHACLRLGDCCDDFNETCTVSDCSVSGWSEWSECDNKCGQGRRTRSRLVSSPGRNGGQPCPETHQSNECESYEACRRRARHFRVEETRFLPSRNTGAASLEPNSVTRGYCVAFTILKISRDCRRRLESFHEGSRVCVWCKDEATGSSCHLYGRSSSFGGIGRWEMTNSSTGRSCRGKWMADLYAPARNDCSSLVCGGGPVLTFL
ncbi:somatomedin-B and thrombospondin type-1 domain-containing protein-like [Copidosoma floridanum]|uniref:somatomedin-B and thrombospondin type-1 domain-containing protein-like n=1 Tax=Copidosoma floridanum TaxID=29053 RepID=UPI0006C9CA1E|nr:somatomedin-B and thrombospondin type-1 domain-containing protein-like [Copidosoma floridanum]